MCFENEKRGKEHSKRNSRTRGREAGGEGREAGGELKRKSEPRFPLRLSPAYQTGKGHGIDVTDVTGWSSEAAGEGERERREGLIDADRRPEKGGREREDLAAERSKDRATERSR